MTARTYVETSTDTLEAMAWDEPGLQIEPDPARGLMFLRVGTTTFAAPLREVTG